MYRAPKDTEFLKATLKILPRHPEYIDDFIAYFSNYGKRPVIAREALKYLQGGLPYSYVRGELWHVIARLGDADVFREGLPRALEDARNRKSCDALSWGVMHFLIACESKGIAKNRIGIRLGSESPLSRALLAKIFSEREFVREGKARSLLKGTLEEQLAMARELQRRRVSLYSLGLRQRDLSVQCVNSLRALGVIRRRRRKSTDYIADILVSLYGCENIQIWRNLLGSEYEHALQILVETQSRFVGAYSEWLALQDSFNDIVVRKFFSFLSSKGLDGHSRIIAPNNKLVKFGALIQANSPFDRHFNLEAGLLRIIHNRRNRLPRSHPYDERGGAQNKWLKRSERDSLVPAVRDATNGIISAVSTHSV